MGKRKRLTLLIFILAAVFIVSAISAYSSQQNVNLEINEKILTDFRLEGGSIYIKLDSALPYSKGPIQEGFIKVLDGEDHVHARHFFTHLGYHITWDDDTRTARITREIESLPALTEAKLKTVIKEYTKSPFYGFSSELRSHLIMEEAPAMDDMKSSLGGFEDTPDGGVAFSDTNIQVLGVDEADIVKTDGKYLYQLTGDSRLKISHIFPADQLQLITEKDFSQDDFIPVDLYIHGDQLVVIGSYRAYHPTVPPRPPVLRDSAISSEELPPELPLSEELPSVMPPYYWGKAFTRALVLSFTGDTIETVREIDIEGDYLSSRKIDSYVYLLSNMYVYDIIVPQFRDTTDSDRIEPLAFDQISCLPGPIRPSYVNIVSFDLEDMEEKARVTSYLGAGREVYMSRENIYMTVSPNYRTTEIYKFAVSGTSVKYDARGEVNGTLLNQFSMDEHNEFFRIATTSRDSVMSNNLFVLNRDLDQVAEITDIAPTERIYAARFMGDKAYLVTFEIIDPFFVIDLSDPFKPEILGELKIPGFSNYLHPIDDIHILGIGKEVEVVERKDSLGNVIGQPFGVEKGLKMSVFDVSDVENPVEKHQVILGTEGTHSEAQFNHKAVLFDRRNNIISLPVYLSYEYKFNNQGAYVYRIDLDNGFELLGTESHLKPGSQHDYQYFIKRTLYVNDYLYFISDSGISVRTIEGFSEAGQVNALFFD